MPRWHYEVYGSIWEDRVLRYHEHVILVPGDELEHRLALAPVQVEVVDSDRTGDAVLSDNEVFHCQVFGKSL